MVKGKLFLPNLSITTMHPISDNVFMKPNHKKNGNYYGNAICPIWWMSFDFKETSEKKSFSCKTQALKSCIPIRIMCLWCPITKRMEIIMRIQFVPFDRWTLILRKLREGKAFLAKSKHQNRVSRRYEHDWRDNNKKNRDY